MGQLLIYVDSVIVLLGLFAFGDWKIPLYSWLVIFITGKVIDATLTGANYDKPVVFTTLNRRELVMLENHIREIDDEAFLTVMYAKEVLGNGFKSLKEF